MSEETIVKPKEPIQEAQPIKQQGPEGKQGKSIPVVVAVIIGIVLLLALCGISCAIIASGMKVAEEIEYANVPENMREPYDIVCEKYGTKFTYEAQVSASEHRLCDSADIKFNLIKNVKTGEWEDNYCMARAVQAAITKVDEVTEGKMSYGSSFGIISRPITEADPGSEEIFNLYEKAKGSPFAIILAYGDPSLNVKDTVKLIGDNLRIKHCIYAAEYRSHYKDNSLESILGDSVTY